jgi:ribosomal protein S18 acetylase RimI-like enzyme
MFVMDDLVMQVLSEMNKKIKYNPAERFVCLVAIDEVSNSVVGVVDVSYLDEKEVLRILGPGVDGFVYIASMTVHATWRRRGVALELLEAAKLVAKQWSEGAAYLHVYQDNAAAIQLYKKHGFEIIFQDPSWLAMVGVRPRFLMRKGYT